MQFTEARLEQAIIELLEQEGYQADGITTYETNQIIHKLESLPALDLYDSNKAIMQFVSNGFLLKREEANK